MSAPIAPFAGAALEPQLMQAQVPTDLTETIPFDVTLGAAIASGLSVPLQASAPAPSEPLLELLLDGEWLPDEPAVLTEDQQPAPAPAAQEPMVLEKNLDSWLAAFGRRERSSHPSGDGDSDPHVVTLDEPDARAAAVPEPTELLTTVLPSIGLSRPWAAEAVAPPQVQPRLPVDIGSPDRLVSDSDPGLIDPRPPFEVRRVAQPMVEIGGFDFPSLPDWADSSSSTLNPGLSPAAARPWVEAPDLIPSTSGLVALPPELAPPPPDVIAQALPLARGSEVAGDLIEMSKQTAPADGRLGEVVSRARAERLAHADLGATRNETPAPGPGPAGVVRAVLQQTGRDATTDSRSAERRSRDDRSTDPGDAGVRRPPGPETGAFEPGSVAGRAPLAAHPASSESLKTADAPVAAAPNPFDRVTRRVDHLTLELKDDAGDFGRLRVSVNGPQVRASIMPNDPAMADRLNLEIRQLKMSLQERGFPEPRITVQAPKAAADPVSWTPVVREVSLDPTQAGQPNTQRRATDDDRRDRWTAGRDQRRDEQRQQEQARQSRRDHPGDPK